MLRILSTIAHSTSSTGTPQHREIGTLKTVQLTYMITTVTYLCNSNHVISLKQDGPGLCLYENTYHDYYKNQEPPPLRFQTQTPLNGALSRTIQLPPPPPPPPNYLYVLFCTPDIFRNKPWLMGAEGSLTISFHLEDKLYGFFDWGWLYIVTNSNAR